MVDRQVCDGAALLAVGDCCHLFTSEPAPLRIVVNLAALRSASGAACGGGEGAAVEAAAPRHGGDAIRGLRLCASPATTRGVGARLTSVGWVRG